MLQAGHPVSEYLPGAHDEHDPLPSTALYFPETQFVHPDAAAPAYWPAVHVVHAEAELELYFPGEHRIHPFPLTLYSPGVHATQLELPPL